MSNIEHRSVCPECGYPVEDADEFCPKCAEKLGPPVDWKAAYTAVRQQLEGAVEAFTRYGRHLDGCSAQSYPAVCSCGYVAARDAIGGGRP